MVGKTRAPIEVVRGDKWKFPFAYKDPNNAPIDLTGFTVSGELKWNAGTLALTIANGRVVVTDAAGGRFRFEIEEADSATVPNGANARLIVRLTDPASDLTTPAIVMLRVIEP